MLTTSTGEAMGDSGWAYWRHHETNRNRTIDDFKNEPPVSIEFTHYRYDNNNLPTTNETINNIEHTTHHFDPKPEAVDHSEYSYTISVFHYLKQLDLDTTSGEYNALPCDDWESPIYGVSTLQHEWLIEHGFTVDEDNSFNTYNGDSNLSQVIQGTYITDQNTDQKYVLLQIHQGCDVRGWYTDAKLFLLPDDYMPSESVSGNVTLTDGTTHYVSSSYDGYSLRYDEDDSESPLHEQEIDPKNITEISLSL